MKKGCIESSAGGSIPLEVMTEMVSKIKKYED